MTAAAAGEERASVVVLRVADPNVGIDHRTTILEHMFESLDAAVCACREAGLDHHRARDHRDHLGMDTAVDQIRTIAAFLRAAGHPELIHPLTMEWVTEGRDDITHAHYRNLVDKLLAAAR